MNDCARCRNTHENKQGKWIETTRTGLDPRGLDGSIMELELFPSQLRVP